MDKGFLLGLLCPHSRREARPRAFPPTSQAELGRAASKTNHWPGEMKWAPASLDQSCPLPPGTVDTALPGRCPSDSHLDTRGPVSPGRGKVYVPAIKKAAEEAGFTFKSVITLRCQCLEISVGSISF